MPLLAVGISHQTAPLAIREKLAFAREDYRLKVSELCNAQAVEEAVLLSTCNRTEVYSLVLPGQQHYIGDWLRKAGNLHPEDAQRHFYTHENQQAVKHLFRVASGLDSLVLGEPQILGQLKDAWQLAREAGGVGKITDRLFQHAFAAGKEVRNVTGINEHPVSVAYMAAVLARQIFGDLASKRVLLVGAGEMIELCGRHFHQHGVGELMIANRSLRRAEILAGRFGAGAFALQDLENVLHGADIVITSTASRTAVIGRELMVSAIKARRHKPVFMVDLAVPRDIEPAVAGLPDIYLYTIDDLQKVADENLSERKRAAEAASGTIESAVLDYMRWLHGARAAESLERLRSHAEKSGNDLATRALHQIEAGNDPGRIIRQLTRTLTHKILHVPSTRLRQAAEEQHYEILKAADWLFDAGPFALEKPAEEAVGEPGDEEA